jgi:hypothetical protein
MLTFPLNAFAAQFKCDRSTTVRANIVGPPCSPHALHQFNRRGDAAGLVVPAALFCVPRNTG